MGQLQPAHNNWCSHPWKGAWWKNQEQCIIPWHNAAI
jgi:hypothetical protein